ncbi:SAM binding domain-containing protein containing protein [Blastomyces gilchristii SLH14081]|uniref:SAM binding domain-containing protein containing protein n=1 Tax=Blastomyces gilchristii (strain SLH14081) TaxID=559298 RepID=A0A179UG26_BLAGS|nr:SAM binding domain-containing protein containing protein [Blastomyces gilchristii SLH14081]OAT05961.1 SAM binding domain-containing protein containing protein [Blastomyces gilchristii SLH14081]
MSQYGAHTHEKLHRVRPENFSTMAGSANLSYLFIPTSPLAYDPKHNAYQRSASNSVSQGSAMPATSSSSASSSIDYTTYPLAKRNGRTYLRDPDNPYPLPCDLAEIHRQSLRSLILMHVFGAPFCTPHFTDQPPKRVLELACGSALWSNACHDYFARKGHKNISFTGLDIVNLAPDLQKQGINWQFKRHDLHKPKLPFPDGYFDFVFIKDAGICPSGSELQTLPLSEPLRVLKSGGVLEVWDSDLIFRTLLPNPPLAPGLSGENAEQAETTGTYTIFPATPFADAQNKYLRDYNSWAQKAFERRKLTPMPCAMIGLSFTSESESFNSVDSRRIAIPLGEVRWEREPQDGASNGWKQPKALSADQLALRQTALYTIVQMIESMEPMLMEASGKGRDEWDRWWTGMTTDLLQKGGVASGECLEVGAWWGQKR